jgi:hypothetical protein
MPLNSIVRIYNTDRTIAGAGFLAASGRILTAANVFRSATGWYQGLREDVIVEFPYLDPGRDLICRPGSLTMLAGGEDGIGELLLASAPPAQSQPAELLTADNFYQQSFHAHWFRNNRTDTVRGYLKGIDSSGWLRYEFSFQPSTLPVSIPFPDEFLGSPVWDEDLKGVVGIFGSQSLASAHEMQVDGLVMGSEIVVKLIPDIHVETRTRNNPQILEVRLIELIVSQGKIPSDEPERSFIQRLVGELERLNFSKKKGGIRVWSALRPDDLYLVLEMGEQSAGNLLDYFGRNHPVIRQFGILSVRNMKEDRRIRRLVGPVINLGNATAELMPQAKIAAVERSARILQSRYQHLIEQMEHEMQAFLDETTRSLENWYPYIYREIRRLEYPVTNAMNSHILENLEGDLSNLINIIPREVQKNLEQVSSLWWHKQQLDQVYLLTEHMGELQPVGEINPIIRNLANYPRPLLKSYGYACGKYWEANPYSWSQEMKVHFNNYGMLCSEAERIYRQALANSRQAAQDQEIGKAAY